jgi:inorganic phosphate transporter, PiT family
LPAAAIVGALAGKAAAGGAVGTLLVAVVALAVAVGVFLASRRNPVTAANVNDATVANPVLPATAGV